MQNSSIGLKNKAKLRTKVFLVCVSALVILFAAAVMFPRDECELKRQFGIKWNADLTTTKMYDSHGGFHNDGEALYIVSFNNEDRSWLENWESLPLPPRINGFIYGHNDELYSTADRVGIPKVTSGKWKYVDRGNTIEGYRTFNISICIYDDVNDVIYYYIIDT